MDARVRAMDWSRTPLGPMGQWPRSLLFAVDICLRSPAPMVIGWGPGRVTIHNDAAAPILGGRHPDALGRPARELWHEISDEIGPLVDAVFLRGESTRQERRRLVVERDGRPEDAYFTLSYSPIPDDAGGIGGFLCVFTEETQRVRAEAALVEAQRRVDLGLSAGVVGTWEWDLATGHGAGDDAGAGPFPPSPVLRGARLLVVEDDAETRTVVQWLLEVHEANPIPALALTAYAGGDTGTVPHPAATTPATGPPP